MLPTYKTRIVQIEKDLSTIQQKMRIFSWMRLLVFLLILLSFYYYFSLGHPAGLLVLIIALTGIFLIIVRKHADIKYEFTVHDFLLKINRSEEHTSELQSRG